MIYPVLRKEAENFVSGKKVDRKWKKERISTCRKKKGNGKEVGRAKKRKVVHSFIDIVEKEKKVVPKALSFREKRDIIFA